MKPLLPAAWDPSLQHIIDDMNGAPINIHCLLANHPALLNAWWQYRMYSVRGGELTARDTEIVILRVSVHMKAWYEWAAHVDRGLVAGLSMEEIERVVAGPTADHWREKESSLLSAVDSLIERRRLSADLRAELGRFYTDSQIMDVISLQGMYVTIACLIGTWDIDIEESLRDRLPDHVSEASFQELLSATNSD